MSILHIIFSSLGPQVQVAAHHPAWYPLTGQQNIRPLRGYHFDPWLITVKTWELSNQLISDLNRIGMWMCW